MPRPKRLPKFLSESETDRLFSAADSLLARTLLSVGFLAGLRVSEIVKLRCEDVDFGQGMLSVRLGKGGRDRAIPMSQKLSAALRLWLGGRISGYVFPSPRLPGRHLSQRFVQLLMRRLARIAGLQKPATPHSMRHSCATRLLHTGADLREVQEILGHSSVAITEIYCHVLPERLRGAVDRL